MLWPDNMCIYTYWLRFSDFTCFFVSNLFFHLQQCQPSSKWMYLIEIRTLVSTHQPDEFVPGNIWSFAWWICSREYPKLLCLVHRDFRHCLVTYTPKISLIILLAVCDKVLLMLDRRIFYWIIYHWCNPQIDIFLKVYSHLFSAWYCVHMVRRIFVLETHGC